MLADSESHPEDLLSLRGLMRLRLSGSVVDILKDGQALAARERLPGDFGTGLLLISIHRVGIARKLAYGKYAPTEFARMIARAGTAFEVAVQRFLANNRSETADENGPESISTNLRGVFDAAAKLPSHDGILAARHLIVALLAFDAPKHKPANSHRILQTAGLDTAALYREFVASLARDGEPEERAGWAAIAASSDSDSDQSQSLTQQISLIRSIRPGYGADAASGSAADDCLRLEATVSAMANLIASPELDGNLSLGVFGNWGSGKSFFMRRLRGAIDELTARARRASESDEFARPAYWPNVVQAEFNAWHYVDSNLWASLVSHLLQELRRFKPTLQNEAVATPLNVALNQLQIAADARDAATSHQTAATSARDAAENALKAAEADVEHAIASLAKESARSLWEVVDTEFSPERKGVVEQLEALGMTIDNANTTLKPVYTQLKELTSTGGRLQALASDLLRSRGTRRQFWLLAAMVVGPLVALALLSKSDTLAWLRDGATWLATTLVSLAAAVVQGADWLRGSAAALQKKLAPLNSVRLRIESALERAQASKGEQIVKLEKSLASKEAALAAARANAVAREQELQIAVEAVKDAVSGRTITRFIEQRLASSDYQKHLGLIAIIRNDFERLSQLISGYNAQRLDLKDKEQEIRDALRRAATGSLENIDSSFANLGVNRIVLYIDDLDRCPSERVVEVLQAIHLLLAFPVFVVIVGVDARWMAHALAKEYPTLLAHGSERSSSGAGDSLRPSAVTPSDYLEKIFQIPYWVPPLTTLSTNSLLDQLMLGDPQVFVQRTQDDHPVLSSSSNDNSSQGTESSSSMAIPHGRETSDSGNGAQHRRNSKASHQNPSAADPTVLTPPVVLHLNAEERAAMHALATIIGRSPRATKRFVNSYRLLKASLTTADRQEFGIEDDRLGGLATPMLMLAVVTGAPSLAAGFLSLPDGSTVDLLHHLSQLARGTNDGRHVASTLQRVLEFCDAEQGYWRTPVELPAARTWAIRVAQFSFEDLSTLRPATLE